jgi:hypothetical protein
MDNDHVNSLFPCKVLVISTEAAIHSHAVMPTCSSKFDKISLLTQRDFECSFSWYNLLQQLSKLSDLIFRVVMHRTHPRDTIGFESEQFVAHPLCSREEWLIWALFFVHIVTSSSEWQLFTESLMCGGASTSRAYTYTKR